MEYKRTRYLIQHRETKQYIKGKTGINGKLETTDNAWKAWGVESAAEALYNLENNRYMPDDQENYRIVSTIDQREVNENVQEEREYHGNSEGARKVQQ